MIRKILYQYLRRKTQRHWREDERPETDLTEICTGHNRSDADGKYPDRTIYVGRRAWGSYLYRRQSGYPACQGNGEKMKIAIISDIHGNKIVLENAKAAYEKYKVI